METSCVPLLHNTKSIHETHVEAIQTLHKQGLSITEYSHIIYTCMSVFLHIPFQCDSKNSLTLQWIL